MAREYKVGDLVWAKLKGYPWWPARIEDETHLDRKVTSKKPKNPKPVWPVFFFGSEDYGWFGKDCLQPFLEGLAEHGSSGKKGSSFLKALRQAQDPKLVQENKNEKDLSEIKTAFFDQPHKSTTPKKIKKEEAQGFTPNKKKRLSSYVATPAKPSLNKPANDSSPQPEVEKALPRSTRASENAARASPVTESCSRGRESSLRLASPVLSTASQENSDLETLKSLRQDIQKATVKEGYADHEIIAERLIQLEDTPVTASTIMQSKIGKLLRHLLTNHIPTNDYDFRARFRSLFTHYKVVVAEAPEVANSSPNNGEARDSQLPSSESKPKSELPEAPSSPQGSTVKAECKENAPEQTQSPAIAEPKLDENTTIEDSKHTHSPAANNSKQDESLSAEHEDNKIPPSADLSSEDKNEAVSPKEPSASIHNPTEVPVANPQALICTD